MSEKTQPPSEWEPAAPADAFAEYMDIPVHCIDARTRMPPFQSDNPSPYKRSPLSGSEVERDAAASPRGLFGARLPHYPIEHEKYEHRVILFLKAEGRSYVEIARMLGMSAVTVSNICRQPWAQRRLLEIIHENGNDSVQALLEGEAVNSLNRLVEERDSMTNRSSDRISAADKLLDRLYGKPNQPMTVRSTGNMESLSDSELEAIARTATGSGTSTATS